MDGSAVGAAVDETAVGTGLEALGETVGLFVGASDPVAVGCTVGGKVLVVGCIVLRVGSIEVGCKDFGDTEVGCEERELGLAVVGPGVGLVVGTSCL